MNSSLDIVFQSIYFWLTRRVGLSPIKSKFVSSSSFSSRSLWFQVEIFDVVFVVLWNLMVRSSTREAVEKPRRIECYRIRRI